MKIKWTFTQQLAAFLALYSSLAVLIQFLSGQGFNALIHLGVTLGTTLLSFAILTGLSKRKKDLWTSLITGFILFLLIHPTGEGWGLFYAFLLPLLALIQKFFFTLWGSPIVNPVAFAILLSSIVFHFIPGAEAPFISWWGASFGGPWILEGPGHLGSIAWVSHILILIWIFWGLPKWRKLPLFFSFLIAQALLFAGMALLRGESFSFLAYSFLADTTLYFFVSIMLVEPKTSPALYGQQIVYGIVAALLYSFGLFYLSSWLSQAGWSLSFPLLALALANLLYLLYRFLVRRYLTPKPA